MKSQCGKNEARILAKAEARVGSVENGWELVRYLGIVVRYRSKRRRSRYLCRCVRCEVEVVRSWAEVRKLGCNECRKRERRNTAKARSRIYMLRQIPQELLLLPGAIEAVVDIFGPLSRAETGVVLGIMERGKEYNQESIRLIEVRAMAKFEKGAPEGLATAWRDKEPRRPSIWEELEEKL